MAAVRSAKASITENIDRLKDFGITVLDDFADLLAKVVAGGLEEQRNAETIVFASEMLQGFLVDVDCSSIATELNPLAASLKRILAVSNQEHADLNHIEILMRMLNAKSLIVDLQKVDGLEVLPDELQNLCKLLDVSSNACFMKLVGKASHELVQDSVACAAALDFAVAHCDGPLILEVDTLQQPATQFMRTISCAPMASRRCL
mgnify:CR=1 FL=1